MPGCCAVIWTSSQRELGFIAGSVKRLWLGALKALEAYILNSRTGTARAVEKH